MFQFTAAELAREAAEDAEQDAAERISIEFTAVVNHGYPYRAVCAGCGWRSKPYAATHAAAIMADDHVC